MYAVMYLANWQQLVSHVNRTISYRKRLLRQMVIVMIKTVMNLIVYIFQIISTITNVNDLHEIIFNMRHFIVYFLL